jgi:hypothetical protein
MNTTLTHASLDATPSCTSTDHIKPPSLVVQPARAISIDPVEPSSSDVEAFVHRLEDLLTSFGPDANKHVLANVLITECLDAGYDTRARIRSIADQTTLNPAHVVIVLNNSNGTDSDVHLWRCEEGRYSLLS